MQSYIFWTQREDSAEPSQAAFHWHGTFGEGKRQIKKLGRRILAWYPSNGHRPRTCLELNLLMRR